jgi:hypothetical protein
VTRRIWRCGQGLLVAVSVSFSCAASSASAATLLAQTDSHQFAVRPATVEYTGDGAAFSAGRGGSARNPRHLRWKTWGTTAHAVGWTWARNFDCGCSGFEYQHFRGSLTASRIRHGHYTRLVVRTRRHGHVEGFRWHLTRFGGLPSWGY